VNRRRGAAAAAASVAVLVTMCALTTVATAATAPAPAPAAASTSPAAASDLGVSFPADPIRAPAGGRVTTSLTVSNAGNAPIDVVISARRVLLGDNGATQFVTPTDGDPFFGRVTVVPSSLTIPAGHFEHVAVEVDMPARLQPDIYVVGLLVSPTPAPGSVHVVNEVGALVALDVPGARDRALAAAIFGAGGFQFGSHPTVHVRVRNVGHAAVRFTSEAVIDGTPVAAQPSRIRQPPLLLVADRHRDVAVGWHALFGLYHVHVRVLYNATDQQTREIDLSRTVFVASPWQLVAVVAVLLAVAAVIVVRRRGRVTAGRTRK
jgi:hypothetical protein